MVCRVYSAFLTFFLRRVLHLNGRLIHQILAIIMKVHVDFGGCLIRADIR